MSWSGTYSHNVLYAIDVLAGTLFWNVDDVTISSLCRVWYLAMFAPPLWGPRLASLKLYGWQVWLLGKIHSLLEWIKPGHCESARLADIGRGERMVALLS